MLSRKEVEEVGEGVEEQEVGEEEGVHLEEEVGDKADAGVVVDEVGDVEVGEEEGEEVECNYTVF